jgi:hypothetical protein
MSAVLSLVVGPAIVLTGVITDSLAFAVGADRSATTCLGSLVPLAQTALAATCQTRSLPLLPLSPVGEPLLLGEEKLATDGDWL